MLPPRAVYNAMIAPLASGAPLTLRAGASTTLIFHIGPEMIGSVLGTLAPEADLDTLVASQGNRLMVVLDCLVCADNANQVQTITYDVQARTSTRATFSFLPSAKKVEAEGGLGKLVVTVMTASGIELDTISIPVLVGDATEEARKSLRPPSKLAPSQVPDDATAAPDLILFIAEGGADGLLSVKLYPRDPALREKLTKELGRDISLETFTAGMQPEDVRQLVARHYGRLSQIAEQNNSKLRDIYGSTAQGAVTLTCNGPGMVLCEDDSNQIFSTLHDIGFQLFDRLFAKARDPDLFKAMLVIGQYEKEDATPLRVRIHNSSAYLPWQLVNDARNLPAGGGEARAHGFWGFRYELGVRQVSAAISGPVPRLMPPPTARETIYGGWAGTGDETALRAQKIADFLSGHIGGSLPLRRSREEFLDSLGAAASYVRFLMVYTHGSSGSGASSDRLDRLGGRLMFFKPQGNEALLPSDVDALSREWQSDLDWAAQKPLFAGRPVVFLNACESGTGGLEPMTNNGFIAAFLRNGAGAVVVTESPIWIAFADSFGRDFLEGLLAGQMDIQRAMYEARWRHLRERHNPLGLMFALYGNTTARFSSPGRPK